MNIGFGGDKRPGFSDSRESSLKGFPVPLVYLGKGKPDMQINAVSKGKAVQEKVVEASKILNFNISSNDNNCTSDKDESEEYRNGNNSNAVDEKKVSPRRRMKWTDDFVRLLIRVVSYVGDDGSLDHGDVYNRRTGCLQKKGKWKDIAKIMSREGCHVSPQQCEDKFNDLNKRYKKLNDVLGKGIACEVVENPSLLDFMPDLSPKSKEVVRKILMSKHLFFEEMCSYHNVEKIPDLGNPNLLNNWQVHISPVAQFLKENGSRGEKEAEKNYEAAWRNSESEDTVSECDYEDENAEKMGDFGQRKNRSEEKENAILSFHRLDNFQVEIAGVFQDPSKTNLEQREWLKRRVLQLKQERVDILTEALELEKRLVKWKRFCNRKETEMEMAKLEKERLMVENERMLLRLKQKALDIELEKPESLPYYNETITKR